MGWHDMNGWNWAWMTATMVLLLGFVATLVIVSLRRTMTGPGPRPDTAEDTLRSGLARGQIDEDEYRRRLDTLRS